MGNFTEKKLVLKEKVITSYHSFTKKNKVHYQLKRKNQRSPCAKVKQVFELHAFWF